MKRYCDYMDAVKVSEQFHEKLLGLAPAAKKPGWKQYGALAAALVLVLGAGAFGLSRLTAHSQPSSLAAGGESAAEEIGEPDIALEEPDPYTEETDGTQTMGGYAVTDEEYASYYLLPEIAYGTQSAEADMDLAPPDGGTRDATMEDLLTALGAEESDLTIHLGWGGYDIAGNHNYVGFEKDGSVWMMEFYGKSGSGQFSLELSSGRLPPSCYVVEGQDETVTDVWGVEVSGVQNVGILHDEEWGVYLDVSRQVTFMVNDVGCRFTAYGTDDAAVEEFVSRFVRWAVVEGLDLTGVTPDGAVAAAPEPSSNAGEPDAGGQTEPGSDAEEFTVPYDPGELGEESSVPAETPSPDGETEQEINANS